MNNEKNVNYTPTQNKYKDINLEPFRCWVLNNFPFIAEDFDALTYYEMLCKIVRYLNDVINNQNLVETDMTNLFEAYNKLQTYVNTYFDNLDVQSEINNKLDNMVETGELTNIISNYVQPQINEQNTNINNFENSINNEIDNLRNQVASIKGSSPTFVTSIEDMTDNNTLYILSTNGHLYYYNGSTFVDSGYVYANNLENNSVMPINLNKNFNGLFDSISINAYQLYNRMNLVANLSINGGINRFNFDTSIGEAGTGSRNYCVVNIDNTKAPICENNKLNKIIDCIIYIDEDNNDMLDVILAPIASWGNTSTFLTTLKKGLNYVRLNNGINYTPPTEGQIFQYIIIRGQLTDLKGYVMILNQNDVLYNYYNNPQESNVFNYNFIGDSLTAQGYSNYINRSNKNVYAIGGEAINTIYERVGINPLHVLNKTISTGENVLLLDSKNNAFKLGIDNVNPIEIDNITGNISLKNNELIFIPSDLTETKNIYKPQIIPSNLKKEGVNVIWVGTNNMSTNTTDFILDNWLKASKFFKDYIIVGLTRDTETRYLNMIETLDNEGIEKFGNRYVPLHNWIVNYGMDYVGLNKTDDDITAINNNKIPPSLLSDAIHFNENGKKCVAHLIEQTLDLLNYTK